MKYIRNLVSALRMRVQAVVADSLMRNALFLMLSTAITAAVGFVFWNICSRTYSPSEVGLATTLISATALISTLSMWGFNNTLISFLPKAKTSRLTNTAFTAVLASSIVMGLLFLVLAHRFDPHLPEIMHTWWQKAIILVYISAQSLNSLADSVLIAKKQAQYILIKNSLASLAKLVLPWLLVGLAGFGIFASIVAVTIMSVAMSAWAVIRVIGYHPRLHFDKQDFRQVRTFTLENYVGNIFGILPSTLVPLTVSWVLGSRQVAFFYIALTISALLNVIPSAASQSFFAEASHKDADPLALVRKAALHVYMLLIPAVLVIVLAGGLLLSAFGKEYSTSAFHVLQLLAVSSIFGVVNYLGDTYLNVQRRTRAYMAMNALNAVLVVVLVVIGMRLYGLIGAGYGWLAGQILTNLAYLALIRWRR